MIMIADLQALTDNANNPELIKQSLNEVVLDYLSVGIDPSKSTIFVQSQISEHSELMWVLSSIANMGNLNRMTQFKSKSVKSGEINTDSTGSSA